MTPDQSLTSLPQLLDVRAVAALLSVSVRTVFRMEQSGRIPRAIRLGAVVRWRQEDLENRLTVLAAENGGKTASGEQGRGTPAAHPADAV